MPLFDVPGWSVKTTPVEESSLHVSKKRKRPISDPSKLHAAEINLDKLVERLKTSSASLTGRRKSANQVTSGAPSKTLYTGQKLKKKSNTEDVRSSTLPPKSSKTVGGLNVSSPRQLKKRRVNNDIDKSISGRTLQRRSKSSLTALQLGMKQSLDGARFRLINESLYKCDSREAYQMMQDDPHVYEEYHTGFSTPSTIMAYKSC